MIGPMGRMIGAEEFSDHLSLTMICCGEAMDMFVSTHSREGGQTVHRIGHGCRVCGATVLTSYRHRAP